MTINNLLQINIHPHSDENGYQTEHAMLCGGKCYRHDESSIPPATKSELDRIADALVLKEAAVLRGSAVDSDGMDGGELSYWKVVQGHHRTPLLGNYSFEVLETALRNRNVNLEWVKSAALDDIIASCHAHNRHESECTADATSASPRTTVTIGFVINSIPPLSFANALTRLTGTSRHWWAITRLRRLTAPHTDANVEDRTDCSFDAKDATAKYIQRNANAVALDHPTGTGNRIEEYQDEDWHVVNSTFASSHTKPMNSKELKEFLHQVILEKGRVFRATMTGVSCYQQ